MNTSLSLLLADCRFFLPLIYNLKSMEYVIPEKLRRTSFTLFYCSRTFCKLKIFGFLAYFVKTSTGPLTKDAFYFFVKMEYLFLRCSFGCFSNFDRFLLVITLWELILATAAYLLQYLWLMEFFFQSQNEIFLPKVSPNFEVLWLMLKSTSLLKDKKLDYSILLQPVEPN